MKFYSVSRMVLVLTLALVFVGCLQPQKQTGLENSSATFDITNVTLEKSLPADIKKWAIPYQANYSLKACVIDRNTRDKVIGKPFQLETASGKIKKLDTDNEGCLRWNEKVEFEFFGEQRYLQFDRKVIGQGSQRGTKEISFAVDPWKSTRGGDHAEFVYLKTENMIDEYWLRSGDDLYSAQTKAYAHNLYASGLTVQIEQERIAPEGLELSMYLEMDPYTLLKKMDGKYNEFHFKDGKFDIDFSIIGVNMGKNQDESVRLALGSKKGISVTNREFYVNFDNFILKHKPTGGNLLLAIQIKGHDISDEILKPFQALYKMGEFNQWLGKKSPLKEQDNNEHFGLTYNKLMKSLPKPSSQEEAKLLKDLGVKSLDAFEFSYFDIDYNSVVPGETATNRSIAYDVRVCVKHPLRGNIPAENETFTIVTETHPKGLQRTTDSQGCMGWVDQVNHYYYQVERYLVRNISISHGSQFKKELKIAINPWDLFATFGKDLQKDPGVLEEIRRTQKRLKEDPSYRDKIESRFNILNFDYTAIKFDYGIQKDLSLNVKKTVLLRVGPEVQRYSSITHGRRGVEWLRDGIWLLKVAIHKDYLDPAQKGAKITRQGGKPVYEVDPNSDITKKHFITYQTKLVRVINGSIVTPVTFEMKDLRLMRIRSNFLVQVEPIDERKLLMANWYGKQLDNRAQLDDRMYEEYLQKLLGFIDVNFGAGSDLEDGELERDRKNNNPSKYQVQKIKKEVEDLNLGEGNAWGVGQEAIESKREYRQHKMNLVNEFLKKLDAVDVREALQNEDRERINNMIQNANTGAKQRDNGQRNQPIDIGLLEAVNSSFSMTDSELANLRLNDFSVNPVEAFFDIELLIDSFAVSGLKKRTFIGPITFLLNSNGSKIRPTDMLAEHFCMNNTCAKDKEMSEQQLREWTYKKDATFKHKRYYNSVAHFYKKNVDDLIACKDGGKITDPEFCGVDFKLPVVGQNENGETLYKFEGLDKLAEREVKGRSLTSNFAKKFNLDYISLQDKPLVQVSKNCEYPYYDESCLVGYHDKVFSFNQLINNVDQRGLDEKDRTWSQRNDRASFLKKWAKKFSPMHEYEEDRMDPRSLDVHSTHRDEIMEVIISGKIPKTAFGYKLCSYMALGYTNRLAKVYQKSSAEVRGALFDQFVSGCFLGQDDKNGGFVAIDRRLRVEKTRQYAFKGGKSMNINVGSNTGITQSKSNGLTAQGGGGIPSWMKKGIPLVGEFFNGSIALSSGLSKSKSSGTNLGLGAYLVMQAATFDLELESFERCAVVKYSGYDVYKKDQLIDFSVLMDKIKETVSQKENIHKMDEGFNAAMDWGLMICSGEVETPQKAVAVRERFYYFTQHFTEGDMLDAGDLYNHPWLVMLRGRRDLNVFMSYVNGFSQDLSIYSMKNPVAHVQEYTWPIENLVDSYLSLHPTFPGFYTILANEPNSLRDFPWGNQLPEDSFVAPLGLGLGEGNFNEDEGIFEREKPEFQENNSNGGVPIDESQAPIQ